MPAPGLPRMPARVCRLGACGLGAVLTGGQPTGMPPCVARRAAVSKAAAAQGGVAPPPGFAGRLTRRAGSLQRCSLGIAMVRGQPAAGGRGRCRARRPRRCPDRCGGSFVVISRGMRVACGARQPRAFGAAAHGESEVHLCTSAPGSPCFRILGTRSARACVRPP